MDEILQVEMLKNDSNLFEEEFNNLRKFYNFDCEMEIHDFVMLHPGIIVLLNEFQPSLSHYFPNCIFELVFERDTSGSWFDQLLINIWMDEERFYNGSQEDIGLIRKKFWPLRKKLDLLGEVIISKRILR